MTHLYVNENRFCVVIIKIRVNELNIKHKGKFILHIIGNYMFFSR